MSEALISIIIPVYNRAHLIIETINSISNQTYDNWECIIVDDGSRDNTWKVIKAYSEKDSRIKCFLRPNSRKKGANACRNIGLQNSTGDYIIWFDSDDLMTPNHLISKLRFLKERDVDFVIAQTQNFENGKLLEPYVYDKKEYGIKASDFILLKIHWYTYDVMMRREIAVKIIWNEKMKSWQDYNYFCKMLLVTENGEYINKILTKRRIHSFSIQKSLNQSREIFNMELLENRVLTYNDISQNLDFYTKKELVFGMMNLCFELSKIRVQTKYVKQVESIVRKELGIKSKLIFKGALFSGRLIKKGDYFLNIAKHRQIF